jgi:hypothetical protein
VFAASCLRINAANFLHKWRQKNKDRVSEKYVITLTDYWNITEPEKEELKAKQKRGNECTKRNTQK